MEREVGIGRIGKTYSTRFSNAKDSAGVGMALVAPKSNGATMARREK